MRIDPTRHMFEWGEESRDHMLGLTKQRTASLSGPSRHHPWQNPPCLPGPTQGGSLVRAGCRGAENEENNVVLFHYWATHSEHDRRLWQCLVLSAALFLFHFAWYSTCLSRMRPSHSPSLETSRGEGFVGIQGERVEGFQINLDTPIGGGELLGRAWYIINYGALPWDCSGLYSRRDLQELRPTQNDLFPALAPSCSRSLLNTSCGPRRV